jgi:type I restriction enzyme S subunit
MSRPQGTPAGWSERRLGDLVEHISGQLDPASEPERAFLYVALENMERGTGRIIGLRPTLGRNIASAKSIFQRGDLLYGRLRPYLQKIAVAPWDGVSSTELLPLRPKGDVDPEYLREYLLSPLHLEYVEQLMAGARMPRLRTEDLLRTPVPLPPLLEQRRIAKASTSFRLRTAQARAQLARAMELLSAQTEVVLTAGHRGALTAHLRGQRAAPASGENLLNQVLQERRAEWERANRDETRSTRAVYEAPRPAVLDGMPELPEGWCWASLSQLTSAVDSLCYGVVQPGEDIPDGVPLVRVNDLASGTVKTGALKHIATDVEEAYSRSRLRGGEVLVSLVGTIGRVAIVPPSLAGANIARALAKITPVSRVPAQWIAHALRTRPLQLWMLDTAREVARKTLNLADLERLPIPLPPAEELEEVLALESAVLDAVPQLERKVSAAQTALEVLLRTTMTQVFGGKRALRDSSTPLGLSHEILTRSDVDTAGEADTETKNVVKKKKPHGQEGAPKLDFAHVLKGHPNGLDPFRLLEAARYTLDEVEAFYRQLSRDVDARKVIQTRPDSRTARLKRGPHAN